MKKVCVFILNLVLKLALGNNALFNKHSSTWNLHLSSNTWVNWRGEGKGDGSAGLQNWVPRAEPIPGAAGARGPCYPRPVVLSSCCPFPSASWSREPFPHTTSLREAAPLAAAARNHLCVPPTPGRSHSSVWHSFVPRAWKVFLFPWVSPRRQREAQRPGPWPPPHPPSPWIQWRRGCEEKGPEIPSEPASARASTMIMSGHCMNLILWT